MKYTYDETTLTIEADEAERAALREVATDLPDHYGTLGHEVEFMERLICNSELDWIQPGETGDLTDAPLLGIRDADNVLSDGSYPIVQRWGYPHYALRSFLTDLMETGRAVFRSSW